MADQRDPERTEDDEKAPSTGRPGGVASGLQPGGTTPGAWPGASEGGLGTGGGSTAGKDTGAVKRDGV